MNCIKCGRELKQDSNFCDYCGFAVEKKLPDQSLNLELDKFLLIKSIGFSILISVFIIFIATYFKLPFLFGGLFLPFFWKAKKEQ